MVVGAGILKTTPLAAANLPQPLLLMLAWGAGGLLSLAGALCFAEMAGAFPDAGGDYFFLRSAYGHRIGFLFAWSRFAVIHTGSMALLAFVLGDYLNELLHLGLHGSALLAALTISALVLVNLAGIRVGVNTQTTLMAIVLAGLSAVVVAGIALSLRGVPPMQPQLAHPSGGLHVGQSLVFIFLAYGGWSDAATLSAEMNDAEHGIRRALVLGMSIVTGLYLLVNWAFLRGLGLGGLVASEAPASDLMLRAFGPAGQVLIVGCVAITSITVMNALLIAGARTTYAVARDTPCLGRLGDWHVERGTPRSAVVAIGVVALVLVAFGTWTRQGFSTMVDYLSPVYWLFLTLSGGALFVLRRRFPDAPRPFRVPWYPWLPLLFMASSAYVLVSSVLYTRLGAMAGLAVLAAGPVLLAALQWFVGQRAATQQE